MMQITKQQYLNDVEAVREELYLFSSNIKRIKTIEEKIQTETEAAQTPTFGQKVKVMVWYTLALILLWNAADWLVNITKGPNGEMATIPSIIAYAVIAYAVYVIYLWFRPKSVYLTSSVYKQELARIEGRRDDIKVLEEQKCEAERKIANRLYYVPEKYMTDVAVLELETYMKQYGANTLDDAIAIYEKKHKRQ